MYADHMARVVRKRNVWEHVYLFFFFFKSTHSSSYKVQMHQDGFFLFNLPAIVFFIFPKNEQGREMPRQIPEGSGIADAQ